MSNKILSIYLDNNATTPCDPKINKLYQYVSLNIIGNPHASQHACGWAAEDVVEEAKVKVASFLNALPDEIIFTSGASEANNLAIIGTATTAVLRKNERRKIIVSEIEHKCVLNAALHLQKLFDFEIIVIPVNNLGVIELNILEAEVDKNTLLVSIMGANNEIGSYQPLVDIGKICRKYGAIFHTDAAQAAYLDLDVVKCNIDLLSLSGHKFYAPKGIGALYINQDIELYPTPIIHGGGQQGGTRSGTLSPALCASIAKGLSLITENKEQEVTRLQILRKIFLKELDEQSVSYEINGGVSGRQPGNLNLQFHNIDAQTLILRLQPRIALSTGSACNSGEIKQSYVLRALGLSDKQIASSIRLAFGRFNTEEDALNAAFHISKEVASLLSHSRTVFGFKENC